MILIDDTTWAGEGGSICVCKSTNPIYTEFFSENSLIVTVVTCKATSFFFKNTCLL